VEKCSGSGEDTNVGSFAGSGMIQICGVEPEVGTVQMWTFVPEVGMVQMWGVAAEVRMVQMWGVIPEVRIVQCVTLNREWEWYKYGEFCTGSGMVKMLGVVYRKWNGTNVGSCIPEVEWYKCGELYTGSGDGTHMGMYRMWALCKCEEVSEAGRAQMWGVVPEVATVQ
jgi:hypothetical protein